MNATIFSSLLVLLQLICVIVVFACLLTRSRFVIDVPDDRPTEKMQIIFTLVFGIQSIYYTVSGVKCRARSSMCVNLVRGLYG